MGVAMTTGLVLLVVLVLLITTGIGYVIGIISIHWWFCKLAQQGRKDEAIKLLLGEH